MVGGGSDGAIFMDELRMMTVDVERASGERTAEVKPGTGEDQVQQRVG